MNKSAKAEWLRKNLWLILLAVIVVAGLYVCYALLKHILFLITAILLTFFAYFYFRNRLAVIIEQQAEGGNKE